MRRRLKRMQKLDDEHRERQRIINQHEAFIYDSQGRLEEEEFVQFSEEAERSEIAALLSENEDWLMDEATSTTPTEDYKKRYLDMKTAMNRVENRIDEYKRKLEEERKKKEEEERLRRKEEERKKREEEERLRKEEEERKRQEEEERQKEEERLRKEEEERQKKEEEEKKRQEEEKKLKEEAERIAKEKETLTISSSEMFQNADSCVQIMVILSNCCSDMDIREVDFSIFVSLRELRVGDNCFADVEAVRVLGLKQLETVSIGENSFNGTDFDSTHGHFCLKDCAVLRELKIGSGSFCDYDVCEIENVPSLEVIEMGELNEESYNFYNSDLLLKSNDQLLHITSRFA